jgi:hypothetical protein
MAEAVHKAVHHGGTLFMVECRKGVPIDLLRLGNRVIDHRFLINVHVQKLDFETVEMRGMRN